MSDAPIGGMDAAQDIVETLANQVQDAAAQSASQPASGGSAKSIADLKPKLELQGKIVKTELYGAFVDLGLDRHGLLHISQLSDKRVNNVTDVVKEGDTVTVYVLDVDKKQGRVSLTLIRPPAYTWDELKVGAVVNGTVVRVESYGAFIDIGAERPGMVHVSELSDEYVSSAESVVKPGQEVQAKVIGIDRRKKQIDLSIKALEAEATRYEEEDEPGEELTAMAMALRKAMGGALPAKSAKEEKRRKKDKARDSQQDEILTRTLQHHRDR
jgi:ribosomal protein S1